MEVTGKVHEVGETVIVSEKFQKRDFVIEYAENPQYPEFIRFEAHQDKCDKLDELRPGDEVKVYFNLRGRPWTDKTGKTSYFNTLALWKFDVMKTVAATTQTPAATD
jgi:uncharacterized protein DUF3127